MLSASLHRSLSSTWGSEANWDVYSFRHHALSMVVGSELEVYRKSGEQNLEGDPPQEELVQAALVRFSGRVTAVGGEVCSFGG